MLYFTISVTILSILLLSHTIKLQKILNKKKEISEKYTASQNQKSEASQKIEINILQNPSSYYFPSNSCMTPNESRIFYYLEKALDSLITNPAERSLYHIFPQVSLYSLVKLKSHLNGIPYDIARRNYIAKSIDFVICRRTKQKWNPHVSSRQLYDFYAYTPVLLIELDGQSHFSSTQYGQENFSRQQANDSFKDALFTDLKIPFIRYTIANNRVSSKDAPLVKEILKKNLSL